MQNGDENGVYENVVPSPSIEADHYMETHAHANYSQDQDQVPLVQPSPEPFF